MSRILFFSELDYWGKNLESYDVKVIPLYRHIPKILKPFRILHFKYKLPFSFVWYGNWYKDLGEVSIIILSASNFTPLIAKYIRKHINKSDIRLVYWYWDPVQPSFSPFKIETRWEKWSFDKDDCRKYRLKYNSTYFFKNINLPHNRLKYDIIFIGQNKGRLNELLRLKDIFQKNGLKFYLHVVKDRDISLNTTYKFSKRIPYRELLNLISQSISILDICQQNQSGLTLRVMEALFFEKKLITNNRYVTGYNFYKKENIFILGQDPEDQLLLFLQIPYQKISTEIVLQYEFGNWLERIIQDRTLEDGIKESISY